MRIRLPSPTRIDDQNLKNYLSELVQALERALETVPDTPFMGAKINVTNLTEQYDLDAGAGTLGDVRSVLGTIINRLREKGVVP